MWETSIIYNSALCGGTNTYNLIGNHRHITNYFSFSRYGDRLIYNECTSPHLYLHLASHLDDYIVGKVVMENALPWVKSFWNSRHHAAWCVEIMFYKWPLDQYGGRSFSTVVERSEKLENTSIIDTATIFRCMWRLRMWDRLDKNDLQSRTYKGKVGKRNWA